MMTSRPARRTFRNQHLQFVDALGAGSGTSALDLLEALLGTGEPPLRIAYDPALFRLLKKGAILEDDAPAA